MASSLVHNTLAEVRVNYWQWLNSGFRLQPRPEFISRHVAPGTRLRATDRMYVMQSNGAYRRLLTPGLPAVPLKRSNLAVPWWR